jgi:hypothetical protein
MLFVAINYKLLLVFWRRSRVHFHESGSASENAPSKGTINIAWWAGIVAVIALGAVLYPL